MPASVLQLAPLIDFGAEGLLFYPRDPLRQAQDPPRSSQQAGPGEQGAPPVRRVSRTGASQQDPGSQTSTDPAGREAAPPDHAGPQADVAGLPDPDAGPRPDAAGRGAGRRTTSPGPSRIPAGTAGPGPVFGPGAGGAAYGSFGRGGGDSPFTTRRLEGEGWRRVAGCRR